MALQVGVDTGGTFTDLVARDQETGEIVAAKCLSTPGQPSEAIRTALRKAGIDQREIDSFVHGTTIATNALIERTGAPVALLTTRGFRDILTIQRLTRPRSYDLSWVKPDPIVPRSRCFEVAERIDARGQIAIPIDEEGLRTVATRIKASGVRAVAISFLFSFLNPSHELTAASIMMEISPDLAISLSHQVFGQWREYERTSTTVIDAYLKPAASAYATDLETFGESKQIGRLLVMRSNGGAMTPATAGKFPVGLVRSGPAGGVIASCAISQLIGEPNLIVADMGGTSFDTCLISGGLPTLTTQAELQWGIPIAAPMVDVRSIGAGGGSVAWLDGAGVLKVGPQSAGANPGPACYGRGGTEPTVTDANLLLGRLDPATPLAGDITLDPEASARAIQSLASKMSRTEIEVAAGILRITNHKMAQALRLVSVDRGHDPRDFAMIAFGGAGPLHATSLAKLLSMSRIVVPVFPGAFSALGCLLADSRFDYQQTVMMPSTRIDLERVERVFASLEARAHEDFRNEGYAAKPSLRRYVEMRYVGQNWEVEVELQPQREVAEALDLARASFERSHQQRFGWHMPGERYELVNFKVTAAAAGTDLHLPRLADGESPVPTARRRVYFEEMGGFVESMVFHRDQLRRDNRVPGPAIIAGSDSTILIPPDWTAVVDAFGNVILSQATAEGSPGD